jgi:hypothetical protein
MAIEIGQVFCALILLILNQSQVVLFSVAVFVLFDNEMNNFRKKIMTGTKKNVDTLYIVL